MLIPEKHIHSAENMPDTGIYFEALEPRLLFSGSPEGVVVETDTIEAGQTAASVQEVENFTYPEDDQTSAFNIIEAASPDELSLPEEPGASTITEIEGSSLDVASAEESQEPLIDILADTVPIEGLAFEETVEADDPIVDEILADTAEAPIGIADVSLSDDTITDETLLEDTLLAEADNTADSIDTKIMTAVATRERSRGNTASSAQTEDGSMIVNRRLPFVCSPAFAALSMTMPAIGAVPAPAIASSSEQSCSISCEPQPRCW